MYRLRIILIYISADGQVVIKTVRTLNIQSRETSRVCKNALVSTAKHNRAI